MHQIHYGRNISLIGDGVGLLEINVLGLTIPPKLNIREALSMTGYETDTFCPTFATKQKWNPVKGTSSVIPTMRIPVHCLATNAHFAVCDARYACFSCLCSSGSWTCVVELPLYIRKSRSANNLWGDLLHLQFNEGGKVLVPFRNVTWSFPGSGHIEERSASVG